MVDEKGEDLDRRQNDKWDKWDLRLRDTALFMAGLAGIINEIFLVSTPRPSILIFLGSLVGLPLALEADKRRRIKDYRDGRS